LLIPAGSGLFTHLNIRELPVSVFWEIKIRVKEPPLPVISKTSKN
jgi:hypothetical protein